MFDKLKFNNLVITNKKKIQQARTITIQKLIQKIRKLKSLEEKKPDDHKNKERLRKNAENMAQLKQFKSIDIMRNVLLLEAKPSAIITNGRATPEEVAIALMAMNKVMLDLMKIFKSELKLNDDNKDKTWRTEIAETSKRRAKIQRTEEKRRKRQELKDLKGVERKRTEWLQQQNNNIEGTENQEVAVVEENGNNVTRAEETEELEKEIIITKQNEKKPQQPNKIKTPRKEKSEKPPTKIKRLDSSLQEEIHEKSNVEEETFIPHVEKRVTSAEEATAEEETTITHVKRRHKIEEKQANAEEDNSITHVVDPFFFTETGENYLSTAVAKHGQEDDEDEDVTEEHYNQNRFGKRDSTNRASHQRQEHHQGNRGRQEQHQGNRGRQDQHQGNRDYANRQQRDFNTTQGSRQPPSRNAQNKDNNRHPSWLAKEKIKPVINKFEGKKITFGEDADTIVSVSNHKPTQSKVTSEAAAAATSGLHPSWVAKQKLKPKIAAFEGKKITFANDDDE